MIKNYYKELNSLLNLAKPNFSKVKVAAIIVTDKGVFKGVNYEDSIPLLSVCAERNAIFNGITNGMKEIYEIHILSSHKDITMCGACRQLVSSFAKPKCKIFTYIDKNTIKNQTLKELLPNLCFLATKKEG